MIEITDAMLQAALQADRDYWVKISLSDMTGNWFEAMRLSLIAALAEHNGDVAGEAYQVIGSIAERGGLYDDAEVIRALGYFSGDNQDGSILPFGWPAPIECGINKCIEEAPHDKTVI